MEEILHQPVYLVRLGGLPYIGDLGSCKISLMHRSSAEGVGLRFRVRTSGVRASGF